MNKVDVGKVIDQKKGFLCKIGDDLWEHPETSMLEKESAAILVMALKEEGFQVEMGVGGIETAFSARYGSGHPVIGLLGEYDALSGLSQQSGKTEKVPVVPGGAGHGCGHNLLGAGTVAAAVGIKAYLEATGTPGTVIYYGCPGEESSSCKAFMARDGVFNELDCALAWHPAAASRVTTGPTLANCRIYYRFSGVSAHSAACPEKGRSALDAVELMNVGVQFLREHVPSDARMSCAITDAGGTAPNVIQDHAEVLYLLRAAENNTLKDMITRVDAIAQGAALMTGTQLERQFVKACAALMPNQVIGRLIQANAEALPFPEITPEELAQAKAFQDTCPAAAPVIDQYLNAYSAERQAELASHRGAVINSFILPFVDMEVLSASSTDVGDVSAVCPTNMIWLTAFASATPEHSWQLVAQGKTSFAHKMMLHAGKILAGTAIDLYADPALVEKAKAEFDRRTGGIPYESLIPEGVQPIPM